MTTHDHDARAPRCVRLHQPESQPMSADHADPALLSQKGRLYLLCSPETPAELVDAFYQRYYTDPSFDIVPVLQRTMTALSTEHPEAHALILLAVVVEGLNLFAVGTSAATLWVDRFGAARELAPDGREARPLEPEDAPDGALWAATYRLTAGDVVIMTEQAALQNQVRRGWRGLGRAILANQAQRLARQLGAQTPLTLVGIPGFAPVADLGLVRKPARVDKAAVPPTERHRSPIWPALLVAIASLVVVIVVRRPDLSHNSLIHLLDWALTPVPTSATPRGTPPSQTRTVVVLPTATSEPEMSTPTLRLIAAQTATPTPTPTLVHYPAPELLFPGEREELAELTTTLRWAWAGSLGPDEWFDVRLWREGTPKNSIAWTKGRSYLERYLRPGWYHWTVTVVRGQGRTVLAELCDEPEPVSFLVLGAGEHPSTATPPSPPSATPQIAPTRLTPIVQPTRASNSAGPVTGR